MTVSSRSLIAVALALVSLTAAAQQRSGNDAESYLYASYYVCDLTRQDEVDRIVEQDLAPIYDQAVAAGSIAGWGWLSHHTGGAWRRLFYFRANGIDSLLTAQADLAERQGPRIRERFDAVCTTHEDYIWRTLAAGGTPSARGAVSLSTYYVCDIAREDRANEIFDAALAAIYDTQVRNGLISSWGWNEHVVGGQYRRMATMTADGWPQRKSVTARVFEGVTAARYVATPVTGKGSRLYRRQPGGSRMIAIDI